MGTIQITIQMVNKIMLLIYHFNEFILYTCVMP
jgi:hypothetical protein